MRNAQAFGRCCLLAARLVLAALCLWAGSAATFAQDVRPVPPLSGRVVDQTGTLTAAQSSALSAKLAELEKTQGSQVVVLVVPTTQPEDIAAYAQRVGDAWKIGRRDVGDGLLIVVAKNDRKVRIEVAKTLEGAIPDLMAKRIINEQITPAFKAGDFAGGLNAAVDALAARIRGEGLPQPSSTRNSTPFGFDLGLEGWLTFLFIAVPIGGAVLTSLLGRKLGSLATGAGFGGLGWLATSSIWMAGLIGVGALVMVGVLGLGAARRGLGRQGGGPIIWTGGGHGGGWGSSGGGSDGGGFSSGGGGDFGGGGASGDW
jgi:uncharacterized protein